MSITITKELVALTGDCKSAALLRHMIHLCTIKRTFDKWMSEEIERAEANGLSSGDIKADLDGGWVYKTAAELEQETYGLLSRSVAGKRLAFLVENGWLDSRNNENHKWDRTLQYRVNMLAIATDLLKMGYMLEGYRLPSEFVLKLMRAIDAPIAQDEQCIHSVSIAQNEQSTTRDEQAIPENTTKNKKKEEKSIVTPEVVKPEPAVHLTPVGTGVAPSPKSKHAKLLELYQDALGYKIPNGGMEGRAAKNILRQYPDVELSEIIECYGVMKKDDFWNGKHLSLQSVHRNFGAWLTQRKPLDDAEGLYYWNLARRAVSGDSEAVGKLKANKRAMDVFRAMGGAQSFKTFRESDIAWKQKEFVVLFQKGRK
jgi:hypothetical protein